MWPIDYEAQLDTTADRMCGAAALGMVLRYFGHPATQTQIWHVIKESDSGGVAAAGAPRRFARTFRVCQDAQDRGFQAVTIRVRDPQVLRRFAPGDHLAIILNHRRRAESREGHFSVLLQADDFAVLVHDPQNEPNRTITWQELEALWQPGGEIASGNVIIGISPRRQEIRGCTECGSPFPAAFPCVICGHDVSLQPFVLLGCIRAECPSRTWQQIICSHCDKPYSAIPPLDPAAGVLPVVGSARGAAGSYFKTSMQIHNPLSSPLHGKLRFRGTDGSVVEKELAVPVREVWATGNVMELLEREGLGTLAISSTAGIPVVAARVFNDAGEKGTSGFGEPLFTPRDALRQFEEGVLLGPADASRFRMNIGIRAIGKTRFVIVCYHSGREIGRGTHDLDDEMLLQAGAPQLVGLTGVPENAVFRITVLEGSLFAYGTVVDNTTNDSAMFVAVRV